MRNASWLEYIDVAAARRIRQINKDIENGEVTAEKLIEHLQWCLGYTEFLTLSRKMNQDGLD